MAKLLGAGTKKLLQLCTWEDNAMHVLSHGKKAQFYVGEVKADAILGFPWLAQNGLDVLTREGFLGQRMGKK